MLRAAESIWRTDTGRQRRENEDSTFVRAPVFVVADGMGGAQAGEVASKVATDAFQRSLPDEGSAEERLADRVREANRQIYELSRAEHGREGMGTTLTAVYVDDAQLAIAHVGDSRAYLLRDGELTRLTQDHSLVDELVRRGKLTEEQAAEHPQRSIITRALGPEPEVEVDTWSYPVRAGDVLLLCSDGLTSMVSEERLAQILLAAANLDEAADALIAEANAAGGRDNITVVLIRLEDVQAGEAVDQPTVIAPGAASAAALEAPAAPAPAPSPAAPRPPEPAKASRRSVRLKPRRYEDGDGAVPRRRFRRPLAALVALLVVLFLVGGGGYLATRQLYFIGTNPQGIVTIYRGLPYQLPGGLDLYETYFTSGVPAALVPADRRHQIFDNQLRSESSAAALVRQLELGEVSQ